MFDRKYDVLFVLVVALLCALGLYLNMCFLGGR
jgi:hypothetical protein